MKAKIHSVLELLRHNKYVEMFLDDISFLSSALLYQGLFINLIYAVFRQVTALTHASVWYGAIAVYFSFSCLTKVFLLYRASKLKKIKLQHDRLLYEYRSYRLCGGMILLMNSGMTGMIIMIVRQNQHYSYPGYLVILSAAYTFYMVISSVINIFKFRSFKPAGEYPNAYRKPQAAPVLRCRRLKGDSPSARRRLVPRQPVASGIFDLSGADFRVRQNQIMQAGWRPSKNLMKHGAEGRPLRRVRVLPGRLDSPLLSASKAVTLVSALMSLMVLQTALISQFGEENVAFRQTANTLTGTAVCLLSLGLAVYMIIRASIKIRELNTV